MKPPIWASEWAGGGEQKLMSSSEFDLKEPIRSINQFENLN